VLSRTAQQLFEANSGRSARTCARRLASVEPARKGADEIELWARGLLEAVTVQEIDIAVDGVRVAGDWAVSHGSWDTTLEVGGNVMSDATRYVVIWERQSDGAWKVVHAVWNSSLPASPGD
jgi:ketosteroid isomerase-like protein